MLKSQLIKIISPLLAITALSIPSYAEMSKKEEYLILTGLILSVCQIHAENTLSYQQAKKYTTRYSTRGLKRFSLSEIDAIKSGIKAQLPNCPFPQ